MLFVQIRPKVNYKKTEEYNQENLDKMAQNFQNTLTLLGEDVTREGLEKTPMRVAKALSFSTAGYHMNAVEILKSALFNEDHEEMVIVKDIELYSMCEHHMLPFYGRAHIGYLPNGKITSKHKPHSDSVFWVRKATLSSVIFLL